MTRFPLAGLHTLILFLFFTFTQGKADNTDRQSAYATTLEDSTKRKIALKKILSRLPPDRKANGPVSFFDATFTDWLNRTGELPPDFDLMPSMPFLPDPLVLETKGKFVPVKTAADWQNKRSQLREQIQYYISGTYPKQPDNLTSQITGEKTDGQVLLRNILLKFGPESEAKLNIEMMIPPGKGPFPVFMTQWNHREWAQIAVKRGYVACVLANADTKDDTEDYARIWAGTHDFSRLMRRAYGSFVAVDYLYTLSFIDHKKIGIAGHSRNGKLSMLAGAFDERITAVVSSSGGSGAEIPWRYTTPPYVVEDIALLTSAQPAWFHPRLRFFIGNENKLPVDQNTYMALMAPRGLMISTSATESASNPWGAEQAYKSAQSVYQFLKAPDQLAIRYRHGFHGTSARDIEDYLDFFDYIFKRSKQKPENKLLFDYTFRAWLKLSGENINPLTFPEQKQNEPLSNKAGEPIHSTSEWEKKKVGILNAISWLTGEEPAIVSNPGPVALANRGTGEDNFGSFLPRPMATAEMAVMRITPYKGFGDYLYGNLYYPQNKVKAGEKVPVIIYLHPFDYSKGFSTTDHQYSLQSFFENLTKLGYAVFAYDMLGFGNRMEEGTRFYHRYPHWSKMGKMIADVKAATDALSNLEMIEKNKIYTAGYALGGTVGLLATALDSRIKGTISVAGFSPMRSKDANTEGIRAYYQLHGLLPRLGFFEGNEQRIPTDFQEVLSAIAPRPTLIIAPKYDYNSPPIPIESAFNAARKVYNLYNSKQMINLLQPEIDNQFSVPIQETIYEWIKAQ